MNKYWIRNDGQEISESEYIKYLEGMALAIWFTENLFETNNKSTDNHSKGYDPMTIREYNWEKQKWIVVSYVFDFHDNGRCHEFDTLEQIEDGLITELKRIVGEQLETKDE